MSGSPAESPGSGLECRALSVVFAALASCAAPARAPATVQGRDPAQVPPELAAYDRQVTFGAGLRSMEDEDFGELDGQFALTLDYCEPIDLGALRLEGGMHYSYDDAHGTSGGESVRLHGRSFELSLGLNLSHLLGRVRPYVGVGVALLHLDLRGIDEDVDLVFEDEEATVGGYAKGGLLFQVTRTSHLGFEFRHFEGGDVSLDGADLATGYDQFLILLGTSFE
jgi:opacity protein-like surface antigen